MDSFCAGAARRMVAVVSSQTVHGGGYCLATPGYIDLSHGEQRRA